LTRKICVVVNSRANYGRIRSVLEAVRDRDDLELQLVVGASALLHRFGDALKHIRADGFEPLATVHSIVEGETPATMAKSTGLGVLEMATLFDNIKPDVALTVADRFETIATAISASYMNIPVAHTQGGEVTGSIDESVRHAVTKLSHLHFPATELAARNIVRMGEDPSRVFVTGCPALDVLEQMDLTLSPDLFTQYGGVGTQLDPDEPYIVVLQHPVTTEFGQAFGQIRETLVAVDAVGLQAVWLWPNVDAGSDDVAKGLRLHREQNTHSKVHYFRHFAVEDYARVMNRALCIVGNSSSALREGSFLGVPAVNIGTRQQGRERGANVVDVGYDAAEIEKAIRSQIEHGRYPRDERFGDGHAGVRVAQVLASADLSIQKRLTYGTPVYDEDAYVRL
jgi:UDP-hydrolysing UDP-N-acetyl-D-glucosamine 2-epimerase